MKSKLFTTRNAIIVLTTLTLAVAVVPRMPRAHAAEDTSKPKDAIEALLKKAEVDYIPQKDGGYKVYANDENDKPVMMFIDENKIGDVEETKMATITEGIMALPEGTKPSPALLKRIAEMNSEIAVGKIGLYNNGICYYSSFWLRGADEKTIGIELVLAAITKNRIIKELKPYIEQ